MEPENLALFAQLSPEWIATLSRGGSPAVILALLAVVIYLERQKTALQVALHVQSEAHGKEKQTMQAKHTEDRLADVQRLVAATTKLGEIAESLREHAPPRKRKSSP